SHARQGHHRRPGKRGRPPAATTRGTRVGRHSGRAELRSADPAGADDTLIAVAVPEGHAPFAVALGLLVFLSRTGEKSGWGKADMTEAMIGMPISACNVMTDSG